MATHEPLTERERFRADTGRTGWYGWVVFAATIMVLLGVFHAMVGLVALFQEDYFVVGSSGLMVSVDYTTWGWTHIILGLVVACAGAALTTGAIWARAVAVIVAIISAVINLAFMAAYPFWSVIMITVDILVIYAVTAHGGRDEVNPY